MVCSLRVNVALCDVHVAMPGKSALTYRADGAEIVRKAAREAAQAIGLTWKEANADKPESKGACVVPTALNKCAAWYRVRKPFLTRVCCRRFLRGEFGFLP